MNNMNKLKRIALAGLLGTCIVGTTACGGGQNDQAATPGQKADRNAIINTDKNVVKINNNNPSSSDITSYCTGPNNLPISLSTDTRLGTATIICKYAPR